VYLNQRHLSSAIGIVLVALLFVVDRLQAGAAGSPDASEGTSVRTEPGLEPADSVPEVGLESATEAAEPAAELGAESGGDSASKPTSKPRRGATTVAAEEPAPTAAMAAGSPPEPAQASA